MSLGCKLLKNWDDIAAAHTAAIPEVVVVAVAGTAAAPVVVVVRKTEKRRPSGHSPLNGATSGSGGSGAPGPGVRVGQEQEQDQQQQQQAAGVSRMVPGPAHNCCPSNTFAFHGQDT